MPNFATVTLLGHLGKDPETKTLNSGDTVTSFSIATNKRRKDGDLTTWWNCTAWGKRGETLGQYLKKGDPILVVGEPCLRPYQTKDGRDGQALEVEVREWTFASGKGDAGGAGKSDYPARAPAPQNGAQGASGVHGVYVAGRQDAAAPIDDDIPF